MSIRGIISITWFLMSVTLTHG